MILEVLVCASACFAATVHDTYARMDATGLQRLLTEAPTREDSLLVRYRLFSLTREQSLLRRIPEDVRAGTGRELALLSALWAYRIPGAAPWNVITFGRRSLRLLGRALEAAPDDALVRLVEAQSLLFRPGIAGGDTRKAIRRLQDLRAMVEADTGATVPPVEVDCWLWYGLRKAESGEAADLRRRILASRPAPLYRAFLGTDTVGVSPFD